MINRKDKRKHLLETNRLLQKYLTKKQKAEFLQKGHILVNGHKGRQFIVPCSIYTMSTYPVLSYKPDGTFFRTYGAALNSSRSDSAMNMLALKLALEEDEDYLDGKACDPGGEHYIWRSIEDFEKSVNYDTK